jgi:endonuclease G
LGKLLITTFFGESSSSDEAKTAERLTAASLGRGKSYSDESGGGDRGRSTFKEDESIPAVFRARLADYFRSGYDRGHMWVVPEFFPWYEQVERVQRVPAADAKFSQVCSWTAI